MSKVSETKERYRFKKKPVWPTCSNCTWFKSRLDELPVSIYQPGRTWVKESELRCSLGDFKVGRSSTCNEHSPAQRLGGEK